MTQGGFGRPVSWRIRAHANVSTCAPHRPPCFSPAVSSAMARIIARAFGGVGRPLGRNTSSPHAIRAPDSTQTPACRARPGFQCCSPKCARPGSTQRTTSSCAERSSTCTCGRTVDTRGRSSAAARIIVFDSNGARPRGLNTASPQTIFSPDSAQRPERSARAGAQRCSALPGASGRTISISSEYASTCTRAFIRHHASGNASPADARRLARYHPYFSSTPT